LTPVKILYLADIRFPLERANGIQSMETCHALASRGHDVALLVRPDSQEPPRDPFAFYGVTPVHSLRMEIVPVAGPPAAKRTGYLTFAFARALGHSRQDVIFTRDLGLASLLVRVPRSQRAPLVYEAHGIAADTAAALPQLLSDAEEAPPSKLRRLAAREVRVWRGADGYVTITAGLKAELERRYGPRTHVAVVPDGTRVRDGGPGTGDRGPATDVFTIGYAGHLYPWKGVEILIEAVMALPDTRGLIVGGHEREPDLDRLKAYALDIDCASRVEFTGAVPPADVGRQLSRADVLVLPNRPSAISDRFTSPLKLFEYMAAGRPIVASDLPSIGEVLTHDRNALVAEAGNPEAFVAAIRRLKADRDLGERLARQALTDVREYTWAKRAERLEALLRDVTPVSRTA
jgi:glycosyltransferase involved in cell wall biosynthesis